VCISPYPTSNQSFQQSHNGIMRTHKRSQFAKIVRIAGHKLNAFGSSDSKMLLLLPTVDPRDRLDINQNLPSWNLEAFAPLVTDGRTCSSRTRKSRQSRRCTADQKISGTAKTSALCTRVCIRAVIPANFSNFSVHGYFLQCRTCMCNLPCPPP